MKKKNDNDKHSYIFTRETLGMTILLFCALMLLILITYNTVFASLGAAICAFMYGTFGYGSYLVVAALACLGVWLVFEKKIVVKPRTAVTVGVAVAMLFMLFHAVTTRDFAMDGYGSYLSQCYTAAEAGYAGYTFGGAISGLIVYPIARGTTFIGAYVIFSILFVLCAYLAFLAVRREYISAAGKGKKSAPRNTESNIAPVDVPAPAVGSSSASGQDYVADNSYSTVGGVQGQDYIQPAQNYSVPQPGYVQPAQNYSVPQPDYNQPAPYSPLYSAQPAKQQSDEDKFSQENLGRKILFDNGEFAAESYRRNMIFNDDSYFNHPVHNEGDYLSSFSSGKKSSQPAQQTQTKQTDYSQSYSESYSQSVEQREQRPLAPSYIYGDKPADSLDDYAPDSDSYNDSYNQEPQYYEDDASDYGEHGGDVHDDYGYDSEPQYMQSPADDSDDEDEVNFGGSMHGDESRQSERNNFYNDRSSGFSDITPSGRASFDSSRNVQPLRDVSEPEEEGEEDDILGTDALGDRASRTDLSGVRRDAPSVGRDLPEHEDVPPVIRRNEQPAADTGRDGNPNDLRNIFSSSNPNISDDVEPDASRLSSRREESRETLFDGDDDDYLSEEEPDLGTRGLRSDDRGDLNSSRRGDISRTPSVSDRDTFVQPSAPARMDREGISPVPPVSQPVREVKEEQASAPEKPKHVWKKYVRPTLDLLADYPENNNANLGEIEDNKKLIIETLENFRIAAHISDVTVGPAITRYDVIIEDRTNIKSAMRYREAIAMALMKENVTTYLNYSKGAISIEVPNSKRTVVGLKSMLTSNEFINCKPNTLTFALGKTVEGKPNCPDITKMPHLLVAGTTGSGKSICLSSLIISLLYKYGPDELRFILVDPKQSEFISYENLPHLIVNEIISDVDKAIKALNWAIKEMERRYALFKEMTLAGTLVKNINEYNSHLPEGEEKLPKIVIILDEFGDLMLQNKKDIESRIIRLVQKSRACGIHLILATQRPSVDCITGLIKSNLPTRIGFKVNSFDDSRTIFDIGGAEKLLGAGDLYFRSASNPDLMRIQGCFIDSPEVQAVTDFVKKNNESYFDQSVSDFINKVEEPESDGGSDDGGEGDVKIDDKFIQALKFCVTSNQASVSMLQRRFPIGYVKACKIIDWMENMNYITQSEGSKPRKVLLSLDEFTRIYGDVDD